MKSKRTLKDALYGHVGKVAKAIANSHRLEIIDLLANGSKSVEHIARETNLSVANASQHLQVLRNAGLVTSTRNGNYIYYELLDNKVYEALTMLRTMTAEQLPEMDHTLVNFRRKMDTVESMTMEEFSRAQRKDVYVLDVRPSDEFMAGHFPGAHSLPLEQLKERWQELPGEQLIAIYCRGPFCFFADEGVRFLKSNGLQAIRLEATPLDFDNGI